MSGFCIILTDQQITPGIGSAFVLDYKPFTSVIQSVSANHHIAARCCTFDGFVDSHTGLRNSNPEDNLMDVNLFSFPSGLSLNTNRMPGQQSSAIRFLIWSTALVVILGLGSCNQPRDPSSYGGGDTFARVSVHVDSRSSSRQIRSNNRYFNEIGISAPSGTALIIAVPANTSFSEAYNSISEYYDKQLVDIATSTVTLTLPLNTSIQLFEYTFVQSYSLNNLSSENRLVFSKAILGPFTLTGSTTSLELTANLDYALEDPFDILWNSGSYNIEVEDDSAASYFLYEKVNWQTMESTSYLFNTTNREFEAGTSPKKTYRLADSQWIETSGYHPSATLDHVDRDNLTVYYTNPDFSGTLVGLIDLSVSGFKGDEEGDDGESDKEGDGDDKDFMEAGDFTPGAIGYILEIKGMADSEYRLEEVAESHDCSNTEFSSLEDYISYHTTSEFNCQEDGNGPCLRFESYTAGQTYGNLVEVIRDENHNVISQNQAGTWEIKTVQTKELLFYSPDDTSYFHDGVYATFWTVLNGKVWEGHYPAGDTSSEPMYHVTFNAAAIADYKNLLESAPDSLFLSDKGDDSCSNQSWDEVTWDNFVWAP